MMRGTALRLYRFEKNCAPHEAERIERELTEWTERLIAFLPSGRLEIVQALNASRELLEILCPVELARMNAILLHTARAIRQRDSKAAYLIRTLPLLALDGTATHAAFSMIARGARPTLVKGKRLQAPHGD